METNPEVEILYTNWRGETAVRRIVPARWLVGSSEWHPESQWLMRAWDVEKGAWREFAMSGILAWGAEAVAKMVKEERERIRARDIR
jgi:predicted DNA-binding transcriptional regulator YafY